MPFRFGVLAASAPNMAEWRHLARRCEELGYSALYVHDHLDAQYAPLVAAAVAAEATTTLHIGTLVLNNDLRNTVVVAREIATLALAAPGRVEVGFGAGGQPSDYEASGVDLDEPTVRVDRLGESLSVMVSLWREGCVSHDGHYVKVADAVCEPRPDACPRVMVGGGSRRVLNLAVRWADTISVNRMPAVKAGGDLNRMYAPEHYDRCRGFIQAAAAERTGPPELQVSAAAVVVLKNNRSATRAAAVLGFTSEDVLDSPAVLIGDVENLCDRLPQRRERWGFSNIVVPVEFMDDFAPVVNLMTGK